MPGKGLLVWHIDAHLAGSPAAFAFDNSRSDHKLVRLMEADGKEEIEKGKENKAYGDAGDYYIKRLLSRKKLTPTSKPNSNFNGGESSGITIDDVGAAANAITFRVDVASPPAAVEEWPVSTRTDSQILPAVSGDIVVWSDNRYGDYDIFGYDMGSESEFPVCLDAGDQLFAAIQGTTVVWEDYYYGEDDIDICGCGLRSGKQLSIRTRLGMQRVPKVAGNSVVWADRRYGDWDIYGYDLRTHEEFSINLSADDDYGPNISGRRVVYEDGTGISVVDLSESGQPRRSICDASGHQSLPAIAGDNVAWYDDRFGSGEIWGYDLRQERESRISTASDDTLRCSLSGDLLTWHDDAAGTYDVYGYRYTADSSFTICSAAGDQRKPYVSANRVVWSDQRSGDGDIYGATIFGVPVGAPAAVPLVSLPLHKTERRTDGKGALAGQRVDASALTEQKIR